MRRLDLVLYTELVERQFYHAYDSGLQTLRNGELHMRIKFIQEADVAYFLGRSKRGM